MSDHQSPHENLELLQIPVHRRDSNPVSDDQQRGVTPVSSKLNNNEWSENRGDSQPETECLSRLERVLEPTNYVLENRHRFSAAFDPWYLDSEAAVAPTSSTPSGKFLLAIKLAGLLVGRESQIAAQDDDSALRLLDEVEEGDPANAAPLLYSALIASRAGRFRKANFYLEKVGLADRYDTYQKIKAQTIFSFIKSPTDYLQATAAYANTPIPDQFAIRDFIKRTRFSKEIAYLMMAPALDKSKVVPDLEWDALEYAIGRSLLDKNEQVRYPPLSYVIRQKSRRNAANSARVLAAMYRHCDPADLDPFVDFIRRRFN